MANAPSEGETRVGSVCQAAENRTLTVGRVWGYLVGRRKAWSPEMLVPFSLSLALVLFAADGLAPQGAAPQPQPARELPAVSDETPPSPSAATPVDAGSPGPATQSPPPPTQSPAGLPQAVPQPAASRQASPVAAPAGKPDERERPVGRHLGIGLQAAPIPFLGPSVVWNPVEYIGLEFDVFVAGDMQALATRALLRGIRGPWYNFYLSGLAGAFRFTGLSRDAFSPDETSAVFGWGLGLGTELFFGRRFEMEHECRGGLHRAEIGAGLLGIQLPGASAGHAWPWRPLLRLLSCLHWKSSVQFESASAPTLSQGASS